MECITTDATEQRILRDQYEQLHAKLDNQDKMDISQKQIQTFKAESWRNKT